jgi:protein-disulfide isomerase
MTKRNHTANQNPAQPNRSGIPSADASGAAANGAGSQPTQNTSAPSEELHSWLANQFQRQRTTNIILVVWVGILTLALAGFATFYFVDRSNNQPTTITVGDQITPPHATDNDSAIALAAGSPEASAPTLDIDVDYQCPYCAQAEKAIGEYVLELNQQGKLKVNYHIRTFLDSMLNNDSSVKAAMAASCADTVGKFPAYSLAIFDNQPKEGVGYTDDTLLNTFTNTAGITGDDLKTFKKCYTSSATKDFVTNMETKNLSGQNAYKIPVSGTPTFMLNGVTINWQALLSAKSADDLVSLLNSAYSAAVAAASASASPAGQPS